MSIGIIAMLLSGIIFGVMDVLLKKILQPGYAFPITVLRSCLTALGLATLYFLIPDEWLQQIEWIHQPQHIALEMLPMAALLCGLYAFGLLFFMLALKYKTAIETVGLNKIGVLVGILVSVFVYKEPFSTTKILACLLVVAGVILIEFQLVGINRKSSSAKGLIFMILARLFWAIGLLFVPFIQSLGVLLFSLVLETMVFIVSAICYLLDKDRVRVGQIHLRNIIVSIGVLSILAIVVQLALNISLVNIPIILVAFLNLVAPTVSLLLSRFYLKECVANIQWLGVGLGIAGGLIIMF